jgi:hypothetical protein
VTSDGRELAAHRAVLGAHSQVKNTGCKIQAIMFEKIY